MKTIKYIIEVTANNKEHDRVKIRIDKLFEEIRFLIDGEVEFYTQQIEPKKNWGNCLYGLSSRNNLRLVR